MNAIFAKSTAFCSRFGLDLPILLAPMAGVPSPSLSKAVMQAGGLGALGALLMQPAEILAWAAEVKDAGTCQINIWLPDPPARRDEASEAGIRAFLAQWGPAPTSQDGDPVLPDFAAQCEAMLETGVPILSSVMGLFPPTFVARLKAKGIFWFANISTVVEARAAEAAGADAVVAQGMEAGGHRGCFDAARAESTMAGLFSLLPAVADAVRIPVVATGGIADARGVAAALLLGASAVQIGTGYLRCPEAAIHPAWAAALAQAWPEDTRVSRVFSGRAGRSLATAYVEAASAEDAPRPAPYPVQRALTAKMRAEGMKNGDIGRIQAWSGQSARLASDLPAGPLTVRLWDGAKSLLG